MATQTSNSTREPSGLELFLGRPVHELLVPVGLTAMRDRGIAVAARYAQRWGLSIRLIHVRPLPGPDASDVIAAARRVAAQWQIPAVGVEVVDDDVAHGVAGAAVEGSLLVLATDHVAQLESEGSVGERIVRATDKPVLLCGPNCIDPPSDGVVVVPLDGSTWAESALEPAAALAAKTQSTLWVVNVVPDSTVAHIERLKERGERVSTSGYIRDVASSLEAKGIDVGWELVQGDPTHGIVQFAAHQNAATIVATTHGEMGLARRVLGSVCMGVAQASSVPVLIVPTSTAHSSELP